MSWAISRRQCAEYGADTESAGESDRRSAVRRRQKPNDAVLFRRTSGTARGAQQNEHQHTAFNH